MKLPPDVEFHEDIPLLVYRPRGLLSEVSVNRIVSIKDLEAKWLGVPDERPAPKFAAG